MTQRNASKGKRAGSAAKGKAAAAHPSRASKRATGGKSARVASAAAVPGDAMQRLEAENKALVAERDRLQAELGSALKRLEALDEQHKQISDRIAWAIDSLQSLLEEGRK